MRTFFFFLFLALNCWTVTVCKGEEISATKLNFETAINSGFDTAQQYISITVVNKNTNENQPVCVAASSLLAALAIEYDTPMTDRKIKDLALYNPSRTYAFSKPEALKHFSINYSNNELKKFRKKLSEYSNQELEIGFGVQRKYDIERKIVRFHNLYRNQPSKQYQSSRDAIACILLERNISPTLNMCTGGLYVENGESYE